MSWTAYHLSGGSCHIVPNDDTYQHVISETCACRPKDDGDEVFVHNAFERGERKPS